jgi:hypothetical protein
MSSALRAGEMDEEMDTACSLKRLAGLLVVALLVPGGTLIALAVLLAGRNWRGLLGVTIGTWANSIESLPSIDRQRPGVIKCAPQNRVLAG